MKKITLLILVISLTFTAFSQCSDDVHSTNWFDAWVACSPSVNPNPLRGTSFWIQYDLGSTYTLEETHFWNINDPIHKTYGIQSFVIDYSLDGSTWTEWGTTYLPMGSGQPTYEGVTGPDLNGINARYILITAISNWGGTCYGFSEFKINVGSSTPTSPSVGIACLNVEIFPNPATSVSAMQINTICNGEVNYTISDAMGSVLTSVSLGEIRSRIKVALPIENLAPGIYVVRVFQSGSFVTKQLVII